MPSSKAVTSHPETVLSEKLNHTHADRVWFNFSENFSAADFA
jgi:hypothetical protein